MDEVKYREEQEGEFEALNSIYIDEITVLSEDPYSFTIPLAFSSEDNLDENERVTVEASLQFTFTKKYPDELPLMEFSSSFNINEQDEQDILDGLKEEASSNLGMAMTFTLVSVAQEHLERIVERIKQEKEELKKRKELELQKEEELKYHGTPVTVESFTKWKINFENELNSKEGKKIKTDVDIKKLTGRQLFERDSTLQFSDAQFYSEDTSAVQVDESLFQDLEDLELEEDDL